jgi:hypothetical protein
MIRFVAICLTALPLWSFFPGAAGAAYLESVEGNSCAGGRGGADTDGTPIVLVACYGAAGEFKISDGAIWETIGGRPGVCFSVLGNTATEDNPVVFSRCTTAPANQHWGVSEGHITGPGGKCLAVNGFGNGATVVMKTCASVYDHGPKELWRIW